MLLWNAFCKLLLPFNIAQIAFADCLASRSQASHSFAEHGHIFRVIKCMGSLPINFTTAQSLL